ncbi:hypothetical protein BCR36DRAFT_374627 [Piromyces finnis]|uniref:Right handed beta helix domain-containing protein n=1 Tax=Piromyces finnis TaxID=1754191 RepID=A0A1Y1UXQ7_9FUNG|nr:hypothetical protein BCR36DRAFT_374627 [Piromyces finnis]|eukprot:ORX42314.1 hypothetical protein BCR36DRAFT_374627 [Piromyces finnis]
MTEYNTKSYTLFNNITIENSIASDSLLYGNNFTDSDFNLRISNSQFLNNGKTLEKDSLSLNPLDVIDMAAPNAIIDNCEFKKNPILTNNGVVSIQAQRKGQVVLSNLIFENNVV